MQPSQHDRGHAATTATHDQSASMLPSQLVPELPLHPGVKLGRLVLRSELPKLISDAIDALIEAN
eukprot:457232-Karenia_brevis.AAC.1